MDQKSNMSIAMRLGLAFSSLIAFLVITVAVALNSFGDINDAMHRITKVNNLESRTSDLVQEIAAASNEQSGGVGQVNAAIQQLNSTTQQNASASEQLASTAEQMSSQAENMQELMQFFRLDERGSQRAARVARALPGHSSDFARN